MLNAIPAVVGAARRRVVEMLRRSGANRPDAATQLEGLRRQERRQLESLLRIGVVREAEQGAYYLEESAWEIHLEIRRLFLASVLLVLWIGFLLSLVFR